jgi:hypothetical protein
MHTQKYILKVESKYEKRIELNMVPASTYCPELGSKVQKYPASIAASRKNCKRDNAHGNGKM